MRRTLLLAALTMAALVIAGGCGDEAGTGSPATTPAAPETTVTSPASTPRPTAGDPAALFTENCAGCHAVDGSGGRGPDLRGEDDVDGIAQQVRQGGDGMPAFAGELTDAQIDALAGYVAAEL